MRIVITGSAGMLAQDLMQVLASKHDVFGLDHSSCDITQESAVRRAFADLRPDLIINCAAFPNVDGCERNSERAFAVNGSGPGNLARAADAISARLFHISTDYVFDGTKGSPYVEPNSTNPLSEYGRSKLEGERQVLSSGGDERHLVIRTSWLFGVHRPNFVERVLETARTRPRVEAVSDQISCLTWTHHLAQRIAELAETAASGIAHLAGSGLCTRYEVAQAIVDTLPVAVPVVPITWAALNLPAKRPAFSAMSSARFHEFGIQPLPTWKDALQEYMRLR